MAAYVVLRLTITDAEGFGGYVAKAEPTVEASKGEFVFRGKVSDELEGSSDHPMTAVLKFADRDSALAWYNSPAYQDAVGLRQAASDAVVVVYED
ncbi:DUF1330 domain-containing protein [Candidatus Poribacteria bacterium]|jgi:uncharacterized protein (DUF1330 family)|nr:DUF1330 domain-containing protein [Candidatus Poribacteria bacterium]MBT5535931.1 DUF1330 domain-containing protein [Candidatus Poribacteria bacterium]MBT5711238.1 DUF1330 domain-containing protein [Candidatus Poribacteria bacterium]MBT7098818.1 DUF1330 domain-containing protein [Candidatus Poribacteria bacterium]MBT7804621.1 DUF1330 domain-containing protein [Candidatus Poribacteria bacterium]